ncbi:MAG: hypothetical protein M0R32_05795 [Candidatus Cloacimonetes bacterium]|jgi:hypothetical protein|nr:hypothetical protein [Candidatus Cloacimonadota bacterium]
MIIDPKYGPQYDTKDGTIGKLQLVKRWVIGMPDLEMAALKLQYPKDLADIESGFLVWHGRNGQDTYATKKEAEEYIRLVIKNNRPGLYPEGLVPLHAWCYPGHFDFSGFIEAELPKEIAVKNAGAGI